MIKTKIVFVIIIAFLKAQSNKIILHLFRISAPKDIKTEEDDFNQFSTGNMNEPIFIKLHIIAIRKSR